MRKINRLISRYNHNAGDITRIKYIVIHYTGALGDAEENCRYFAGGNRNASAHYFIGHKGDIWQSVEDKNIAWHCGAKTYKHAECRNANSIGIEMCVRKRNTASMGAADKDWYFEDATVEAAAELTRYLIDQYGVPASHVIRHYDVTGKICPNPYVFNTTKHTWNEFRALIGREGEPAGTRITGAAQATAGQMRFYIREKNPYVAQSVLDMIPLYLSEGVTEGIRGDLAFAQSCLETGNFTFKGSAITLDQNNFCGIGVTRNGMKGYFFETPQLGIRAQIQHLKAYANMEPLVNPVIDPRFKYVPRGSAEYVEWLGIQENPQGKGWAAGAEYGKKILAILGEILKQKPSDTESGFPAVPFLVSVKDTEIFSEPPKGRTGNGTFTITEVKDGWGKLKSNAGWIPLDSCTRL